MSQNIERKEPTFGQPSENTNKATEQATENSHMKPISFSVHSNQSPGHTFTPVMQRPTVQHVAETVETKEGVETIKPTVSPENNKAAAPKLGFTFTPVEKEVTETVKPAVEPTIEPTKVEQPKIETSSMERVIPTATVAAAAEPNKAKTAKIPNKYRRLLLVALLLLALLLVFFLLKPKAPETAEELQEQGSSLPIEFRPVDEEEAKRAEEEARARKAELEAQQVQAQAQQNTATVNPVENTAVAPAIEPAQTAVETVTVPAAATTPVVTAPAAAEAPAKVAEPVVPVVTKPATNSSVIHQPEKPAQPKVTEQPAKTLKPATTTAPKAETKPQVQATKTQVAKPAEKEVKAEPKVAASAASPAVASKTLTVQKGVTLFQNFRDNGLEGNLSELNKMTKLNGATSRLNPGQKIIVRLDKNNRIVEMNIGSGRYIRQADGNYIYR